MDSLFSALFTARGILYIIIFFGGSVFVHELGHFLAAKKCGLRVDRFSIGFGPKIFGWCRGGTEYRISLLPLGGYVSIPELAPMEMIEGKAKSALANDGGNGESARSVPARKISYLQKVVVFAAGAFFNVLFAIFCAIVLWIAKTQTIDGFAGNVVGNVQATLEVSAGTTVISPAAKAGILPGDAILEIDGSPVANFKEIMMKIALGSGRNADGAPAATLKIRRGNEEMLLEVEPALVSYNPRSGDFIRTLGIEPAAMLLLSDRGGSVALPAGAANGDRLKALDLCDGAGAHEIFSLSQYSALLQGSEGCDAEMILARGEEEIRVKFTPQRVPVSRALGKISFAENGVAHELRFVPAPADLEDFSEESPRTHFLLLNALPENSAAAETCVPGARLTAISAEGGSGIVGISSTEDFEKIAALPAGTLTLFLDLPDGERTLVVLENARAGTVPEKQLFRAGVPVTYPRKFVRESPWAQIVDAVDLTYSSVVGLLNPKSDIGISHLNGIFSIADAYYEISFDLRRVLALTLLININLAFLNLLPIPVLDGGHILFATIERLRRRPIPLKVLSTVQSAFVFLLLGFMLVVLFRDFSRTRGNADLRTTQLISEHQYFH